MEDCAHCPPRTTSSLVPCLRDRLAPDANHAHRCRCAPLVETPQPSPHSLRALRAPAAPLTTCCTARGGGPPASVCPGCGSPPCRLNILQLPRGRGICHHQTTPDTGQLSQALCAEAVTLNKAAPGKRTGLGQTWTQVCPGRDSPASPRSPARLAPASCTLLFYCWFCRSWSRAPVAGLTAVTGD